MANDWTVWGKRMSVGPSDSYEKRSYKFVLKRTVFRGCSLTGGIKTGAVVCHRSDCHSIVA